MLSILSDFFLQILSMSLTAGFVIVIVLVLRRFLRTAPKVFSYTLWAVVLFRLVCPFSVESFLSLLNFMPTLENPIAYEGMSAVVDVTLDTSVVNVSPLLNAPGLAPYATVDHVQLWVAIGSVIWVVGIALMLLYSVVSVHRLKTRVRHATHLNDNIYLVEDFSTPFVMGLFKPRIYLPATLPEKEQSFILRHEQTHIKHFDHLLRIVSFLALSLHWFNPLVWIAFYSSGKDMEMTCDEAVIKALGTPVKKEYTTSLLALATGKRRLGLTPLAFGEGDTKGRVKNILNYKSPTFWIKVSVLICVVLACLVLISNPVNRTTLLETDSVGMDRELLNRVDAVYLLTGTQKMESSSAKVTEFIDFIKVLEVEKSEINASREENRDSSNQIVLTLTSISDDGTHEDTTLNFNENFTEVWVDNGIKPSFSYRVSNPSDVKTFFENQVDSVMPAVETDSAKALWDARTPYVGDNSAVSNLLSLMNLPENLAHEGIKLYTDDNQRGLAWILVEGEDVGYDDAELQQTALLLLALIDNLEEFYVTVKAPSGEETELHYDLNWADQVVDGNVKSYGESIETLQELIEIGLSKFPVN